MTEEERLDDLFKDEQLKYTSIHLHALSYTVWREGAAFQIDPQFDFSNRLA